MKKSGFKLLLSVGVSLLFVAFIYANRHKVFEIWSNLRPQFLLLILAGQLCVQVVNAMLMHLTVHTLRPSKLTRLEAVKVTLVSSFVNFFAPVVGGTGAKAVYLKHKHSVDYASFASIMYANYLIAFLTSFLFGLAGVILSAQQLKPQAVLIAGFFAAGAGICLVFMVFSHGLSGLILQQEFSPRLTGLATKLVKVADGWTVIRQERRALVKMIGFAAAAMAFTVGVYCLAFASLGISASVWAIVVIASLGNVSLLFNVTPGNVGIREAIYASVYSVTGVGAQAIVAFSLLERSLLLLMLGCGWVIFSHQVLNKRSAGYN